jgi:transitional endoplasmic reticulum ATPase
MVSQLLTEMDGVEKLKGVFIIGATSQPEVIDPSLLRPGRFELRIALAIPGESERREILAIHLSGKPLSAEVTLDWLLGQTAGWTGARVESLCRRATLAWFREGVEQGWPEEREFLLKKKHFEMEEGL